MRGGKGFYPLISGFSKRERKLKGSLYFFFNDTAERNSIYFPYLYRSDRFLLLGRKTDNFIFSSWPHLMVLLPLFFYIFYLLKIIHKTQIPLNQFIYFCNFFATFSLNSYYFFILFTVPIFLRAAKWYIVNIEIEKVTSDNQNSDRERNYERSAVLFLLRGSVFSNFFLSKKPYAEDVLTLVRTRYSPSITPFECNHFEQYLKTFLNLYSFFYVFIKDPLSFIVLYFPEPFLLIFLFMSHIQSNTPSTFFLIYRYLIIVFIIFLILLKLMSFKRRSITMASLYSLTRYGTTFYKVPIQLDKLLKYDMTLKEFIMSIF